jgi:integrase
MTIVNQTGESKKSKGNSNNGSIRKRSSGNWELRWYGPAGLDGKSKRLSQIFKGTKKQATAKLRDLLKDVDDNKHVDKSKETTSRLMSRFMKGHVAKECTLRTAQGYQGYIERYIDRYIGSIPYQQLTGEHIDELYEFMTVERGLSNTTIIQLHRIIHKAFAWAIKRKLISSNPANGATPPKKRQHQVKIWDVPTIHKFLELAQDIRFGDVYKFALSTGMRRSEIAGLKWESVDLPEGDGEKGNLSVVSALHRIEGHGLVEAATKTDGSRRSIRMSPKTVGLLKAVGGTQLLQRDEYGPLWQDTGFVFTHPNGTPLIPDQITQDFASVIKRFDLPHLTFHGLRHAFATLALKKNISPKIVSHALGHSKIGITKDLYSHVIPDMQDELADAVADVLSG